VVGDLDSAAKERFESALSDACDESPGSALIVCLLECSSIDVACVETLEQLTLKSTNHVHIIAAPNSAARQALVLGRRSFWSVHDDFREAFGSISTGRG